MEQLGDILIRCFGYMLGMLLYDLLEWKIKRIKGTPKKKNGKASKNGTDET